MLSRPRPAAGVLAAARFRRLYGWHVEQQDGQVLLSLGNGVAAVTAPEAAARQVVELLDRHRLCGPVVELGAAAPRWALLADPNGLVVAGSDLPTGVEVLSCPSRVLLPSPQTPPTMARWIVPPNPRRRLLPILATVIGAARTTMASTWRV